MNGHRIGLGFYLLNIGLAALLLAACGGGGGGSGSTSVDIHIAFPSAELTGVQSPIGDIATIEVVVLDSGVQIASEFLPQDPGTGTWSGTVSGLPVGPMLQFDANGRNGIGELIWAGSTFQTLTGSGDLVTINLDPVDDGQPLLFPRITQITRPAQIGTNENAIVSVSVEGSPNEPLSFAFTSGGGGFAPPSGNVTTSPSGTATIVVTYTAPGGGGTFLHSVLVTNSQGNSVEQAFDTEVVVVLGDAEILITFSPVVLAIQMSRIGGNVTTTAVVDDDQPDLGTLSHNWVFTQTGGSPGALFSVADTNPATLSGYDETVEGDIQLSVTDNDANVTTVQFGLPAGQFPDSVVTDPGGGLGNVLQIAAGGFHTCALTDSGVVCWGLNIHGQSTPPPLAAPIEISAKQNTTCALDGLSVVCWGDDSFGQASPPAFSPADPPVAIAVGGSHACALTGITRTVVCWGDDTFGQLTPPPLSGETRLVAGDVFTCAVYASGVACWGDNSQDQTNAPEIVAADISAGGVHTCAIEGGEVVCWGLSGSGAHLPPSLFSSTAVAAGGGHSCALNAGAVVCWGSDAEGESTPPPLTAPSAISAGGSHTCAIDAGTAVCWGRDVEGQSSPP